MAAGLKRKERRGKGKKMSMANNALRPIRRMGMIGLAILAASVAAAADPEVVAEIKVDRPLRDPSVCRGPDGTYYLTGTVSTRQKADGTPDFYENDGIYLWKSADLKTWTPLERVVAFKDYPYELYGPYRWLHKMQVPPDDYREERVFGAVAPEIHFARDTFWLTISMTRQGTGILRSTTGKAEGPYELVDLLTTRGGDPSLFVDGEDFWWLMDGGFCGKLEWTKPHKHSPPKRTETLVMKEQPVLLRPEPEANGFPLRVGERGAFMVKCDGRYQLIATQETAPGRWDAFVATANAPTGPYGKCRLLIPGGGQATLFQNEKGEWRAACHGPGEGGGRLVIVEVKL
jgi:beta-xylosidase